MKQWIVMAMMLIAGLGIMGYAAYDMHRNLESLAYYQGYADGCERMTIILKGQAHGADVDEGWARFHEKHP